MPLRRFSAQESPQAIIRDPEAAEWKVKKEHNWFTDNPITSIKATLSRPNVASSHESPSVSAQLKASNGVLQNSDGQRVDPALHVDEALAEKLRHRIPRLCNPHYLRGPCTDQYCTYDHTASLTDEELEALKYLNRSQPCERSSECTSAACLKGHMCPNARPCRYGKMCRFAKFHRLATWPVRRI